MGLTRREWIAGMVVAVVAVGLTVLFNLVDANAQLAATIVLAVAVVGAGLVANLESILRSRSHSD